MDPVKIFISYSHKDDALRGRLENHLSSLKEEGLIEIWYDRNIRAGNVWEGEIDEHLNQVDIILLLISSDFIASDYCKKEMKRAIERNNAKQAVVIPIHLRPIYWPQSPFSKLQALPKDAIPITSWKDQEEAFVNVAAGIHGVVTNLEKVKHASPMLSDILVFPRPKRKRIFLALIAVMSVLLIAYLVRQPIFDAQETGDNITDRTITYVTNNKWCWQSPISTGWEGEGFFDQSINRKVTKRLIKGDKIGLFKDGATKNDFNLYQDFILTFNFRFHNEGLNFDAKGIAWVIRAKDFKNYYLFELTTSKSSAQRKELTLSIYQGGIKQKTLKSTPVVEELERLDDSFKIITMVIGNKFNVYLLPHSYPNPKPEPLLVDFEDGTFACGGVGFLPGPQMGILLEDLRVTPSKEGMKKLLNNLGIASAEDDLRR